MPSFPNLREFFSKLFAPKRTSTFTGILHLKQGLTVKGDDVQADVLFAGVIELFETGRAKFEETYNLLVAATPEITFTYEPKLSDTTENGKRQVTLTLNITMDGDNGALLKSVADMISSLHDATLGTSLVATVKRLTDEYEAKARNG